MLHITFVVFYPCYVESGEDVFVYEGGKHLSAMGYSVGRIVQKMHAERSGLQGIFVKDASSFLATCYTRMV